VFLPTSSSGGGSTGMLDWCTVYANQGGNAAIITSQR
jgi:hypothetical protein